MPLKTVFLFFLFFFFFEKAEWRQFTQILVDAEIKEEDDLWGGHSPSPTVCTQMLKEDYVLVFCCTFPLEDVSETGSFSESQAYLTRHLLTLLAAPHLHIRSMGGEGA